MIDVNTVVAWLLPMITPFIIGLALGFIIKKALKIVIAIFIIVALLISTGAIQVGLLDLLRDISSRLPNIAGGSGSIANLIPYMSIPFLIGLVIGLWKG